MPHVDQAINLEGFGFERISHIGKGHYATVSLVRDTATNQNFASKCVSIADLTEHDQERAHQEVFLLQSLCHPLIVAYHSSFVIEGTGTLVIVMEYCERGDLRQQIKEKVNAKEHFSEEQVMSWYVQILLALQYIHSEKVLHRDLKCSNIFLTSALLDGVSLLKLGDFGISTVLEGTADAAVTMVGTPYYMSPEVCRNEPYNWKSDVWSLGCVLYELCMLQHAFDSPSLAGLIFRIVNDGYNPIPASYSQALNDLIKQMLTKSAEARPGIQDLCSNAFVQSYLASLPHSLRVLDATSHEESATTLLGSVAQPKQSVSVARIWMGQEMRAPSLNLETKPLVMAYRVRRRLVLRTMNWISALATLDESGDGHASHAKMKSAIVTLGLGISQDEAACLVDSLMVSSTDHVSLSSFGDMLASAALSPEVSQLAAWATQVLRPLSSVVLSLFRSRDSAQSNTLAATDFEVSLRELMPSITSEELEGLFLLADKTPIGDIEYMQFLDTYGAPPPPPPLTSNSSTPLPPPCEDGDSSRSNLGLGESCAFMSLSSRDFVAVSPAA